MIQKHASAKDQDLKAAKFGESFMNAWQMYHDSFDNNEEAVLDAIYDAFCKNVKRVSPVDLNGTVTLFKKLGRSPQAEDMIDKYVRSHAGEWQVFGLRNYAFSDLIKDPDVVKTFDEQFAKYKTVQSPTDTLMRMAENNGWSPEDITLLCSLPVEDYFIILKDKKGKDLRNVINVCLQFDRIGNASPEMQEISRRAKEALKRIGEESAINAMRVKVYGITVDETSDSAS